MVSTIGSNLGGFLAFFEDDLMEDGCSNETLAKIHRISEVYRNFSENEFADFTKDFEAGYASAKKQIAFDNSSPKEGLAHDFPGKHQG